MRKSFNPVGLLVLGGILLSPCLVHAQASANADLFITSLSATPASGSLTWSGSWLLDAASASFDNVVGLHEFEDDNETTSAFASTSTVLASASAGNAIPGSSSPFGAASSRATTPGAPFLAGDATLADWDTDFTLSSDTLVSFQALLDSFLVGFTGPSSVAEDEIIFDLSVDGNQIIGYTPSPVLGPNQVLSDTESPTLTGSIDLSAGDHELYFEMGTLEVVAVPDGAQTALLLVVVLAPLVAAAQKLRRSPVLAKK